MAPTEGKKQGRRSSVRNIHVGIFMMIIKLPKGQQQRGLACQSMFRSYQGEVIWVDPDDAEVRVVGVLTCHLLQDFQEFKTVYREA